MLDLFQLRKTISVFEDGKYLMLIIAMAKRKFDYSSLTLPDSSGYQAVNICQQLWRIISTRRLIKIPLKAYRKRIYTFSGTVQYINGHRRRSAAMPSSFGETLWLELEDTDNDVEEDKNNSVDRSLQKPKAANIRPSTLLDNQTQIVNKG
uniref:ETS domain-containing protein n=1 Tax=Syphacia muris TaxID=451379 RepID=A0A0N5AWY9_9BILA